jgi:predicted patatin/cPLA2 family phospholipase
LTKGPKSDEKLTRAPSHPLTRPQQPAPSDVELQREHLERQLAATQERAARLEEALRPRLTSRLKGMVPWASSLSASSPTDGYESPDEAAQVADGMAAQMAVPVPPSYRRPPTPKPPSPFPATATPNRSPINMEHQSLQVLRQRVLSSSVPRARTDSFKLGLVVEGGGMRGCVSGGALQALADMGLRDAFDAVYGASAGAINSTYFLSGQRDGVDIYHRHIASDAFIDLRRLWKGGRAPGVPPVLNLDMLLGEVMNEVHPLDWNAVISSPIPLKVVASSLDTLSPVLLEGFNSQEDLVTCLRASACVPEIAGGPVAHRGHRLVDAAVFEAVPFRSAVADGCTHVIVLCTRPRRPRRGPLRSAVADAVEAVVKKAVLSPDYMVPAWRAEVEALVRDGLSPDEMLLRSFDDDATRLPWFAGTHVYPVYPGAAAKFSPLCTDPATLMAGVAEGRRAVIEVAKAALGDVIDIGARVGEAGNVIPIDLGGRGKAPVRAAKAFPAFQNE